MISLQVNPPPLLLEVHTEEGPAYGGSITVPSLSLRGRKRQEPSLLKIEVDILSLREPGDFRYSFPTFLVHFSLFWWLLKTNNLARYSIRRGFD
jgi:hypothetical protein